MENDENTAGESQQDNETLTGQDDSSQEDTQDQNQTVTQKEPDWKAEALKYKAILDRNKLKGQHVKEPSRKSDGLDYGQKAFLIASGIKTEEFDFVTQELSQFGGELEALLSNNYFKSRLEDQRQEKTTDKAIPNSKRRSSQSSSDTVDYWLAKGELPDDFELRKEVVKARRKRESNPFSVIFNNK